MEFEESKKISVKKAGVTRERKKLRRRKRMFAHEGLRNEED